MEGIAKPMTCFQDNSWFVSNSWHCTHGLPILTSGSEFNERGSANWRKMWSRIQVTRAQAECTTHWATTSPLSLLLFVHFSPIAVVHLTHANSYQPLRKHTLFWISLRREARSLVLAASSTKATSSVFSDAFTFRKTRLVPNRAATMKVWYHGIGPA